MIKTTIVAIVNRDNTFTYANEFPIDEEIAVNNQVQVLMKQGYTCVLLTGYKSD